MLLKVTFELVIDDQEQVVYFLEKITEDVTDEGYGAFLVDTFLNAVYQYDDDKLALVLNYTGEHISSIDEYPFL